MAIDNYLQFNRKTNNNFRNNLFWSIDNFRGQRYKQVLDNLSFIDSTDSKSALLEQYKQKLVSQLIQYATKETPFYHVFRGKTLPEFPIIDKIVIRNHLNDFISNKYDKSSLVKMTTSGSTGTPFTVYQNTEKKLRVQSEVIYYSEKAGYVLGERLVYLRALSDMAKKNKFKQWAQNETLIDISKLNDDSIYELLKYLSLYGQSGSFVLLAYASTYDALKDYLINNDTLESSFNCNGIISISEMLFEETRMALSEAFQVPIFSRYSNQENGIIGQDMPSDPNIFFLNEAHYLIEVFKMNQDNLADIGEIGRIVITDLFNYGMPIIRYDTGDVGAIDYKKKNGVFKKVIKDLGGRRGDIIYDAKGGRISMHAITNCLWSYSEIIQFQFIQLGKSSYKIKLNAKEEFTREKELISDFKIILGDSAEIKVLYVTDIPILASGKRKYIVNEMNQHKVSD